MSAVPPKAEVNSEHYLLRNGPLRLDGIAVDMIQAPKLEPRIMRYELSEYEWTAINPMLPNKPRGVRRVNDRRVLNGPYLYRARNLIERFFNKIKQCQRAATRYDKLAANYLVFVKLASIRIWLRANESPLV
jgi:transposase